MGKEGWINGQSCGRCWIVMMIRLPGNAVIQFSAERTMQRSGQLCNRGHHSCKIIVIAQRPPPLGQSRDEGLSWSGLGLDARCLTSFLSVFCRRIIKKLLSINCPLIVVVKEQFFISEQPFCYFDSSLKLIFHHCKFPRWIYHGCYH